MTKEKGGKKTRAYMTHASLTRFCASRKGGSKMASTRFSLGFRVRV